MEFIDPATPDRVVDAVRLALAGTSSRVLIGYSGGTDSTVLLWAATQVVPLTRLLAIHVNHNTQAASAEWEQHCRETTAAMGVAFTGLSIQLPKTGNFEAAARRARLECFSGLLATGDVLLLAHHRRDQAETAFLRLIQGRGVYGMPSGRRLAAGQILRPLLEISREDIELCCRAIGLQSVEDPSNLTGVLDRSWIRQVLLPQMRARWPMVEDNLVRVARTAEGMDSAGLWLASQLPHPLPFDRLPEDRIVWVDSVRWWLESLGLPGVPRATLLPWLVGLRFTNEMQTSTLAVPGGSLFAYRQRLFVQATPQNLPDPGPQKAGQSIDLGHGVLRFEYGGEASHSDESGDQWQIRFRCGGDVLMVAGRRRRASTLLQASVLPWERSRYPLLYCGEELAAIPGLATSDRFGRLRVHWEPRVPMFIQAVG